MERIVDIAANHDASAIAMHTVNHPATKHYQEDILTLDPNGACDGKPIDILWMSPDCRDFSKAKGGRPVSKEIRCLADVGVKWANECEIRQGLLLENVEEFEQWGPLIESHKGLVPCPDRRGQEFKRWVSEIRAAGATSVEWRTLRACDYGAPTLRKRLFLIAQFDGLKIIWPEPTHGAPNSIGVLSGRLLPFRTAAECIDWSIPCKSVIHRDTPLKDKTNQRIVAGFFKFVVNNPRPFIVPITHTSGGNAAYSIDEPLRTITTAKGGEFALVTPILERADKTLAYIDSQYGNSKGADIEAPLPTVTADGMGKQALVTVDLERAEKVVAFMAQHNGGFYDGAGRSLNEPLSTITAQGTQQQLVTAHLVKLRGTGYRHGQPVSEPLHTVTASGQHMGLVYAYLVKYYGNRTNGQTLNEPLHTVTTKERFGLVMVTVEGEDYVVVDIAMRMLTPRELARAQGFPDTYVLDPECWYKTESGKMKFGRLPKTHQIARIGNSVSPIMAKVLTAPNFGPNAAQFQTERLAA
ncbi:hypothetical protein MMA231_02515 [Asticcacaulis sp. MM231]